MTVPNPSAHTHTLSLPRLGEIPRPGQVTLFYVQTGSWCWGSLGGCSYHLSIPTDFLLSQDIQRPLPMPDQFSSPLRIPPLQVVCDVTKRGDSILLLGPQAWREGDAGGNDRAGNQAFTLTGAWCYPSVCMSPSVCFVRCDQILQLKGRRIHSAQGQYVQLVAVRPGHSGRSSFGWESFFTTWRTANRDGGREGETSLLSPRFCPQ